VRRAANQARDCRSGPTTFRLSAPSAVLLSASTLAGQDLLEPEHETQRMGVCSTQLFLILHLSPVRTTVEATKRGHYSPR
jgi:hypothetical protein